MNNKDLGRVPSGQALSATPTEPVPVSSLPGDDPSREMIDVGGHEVLRFHPMHKRIKDGVPRCISCGQVDEDGYHDAQYCPGMGGWLPFPTSTLTLKLRADGGFGAETKARITLEQWILISRIIDTPDTIPRSIVNQDGENVGVAYASVKDLLKVDAFTDDDGTAWMPPTAWAYFAVCRARDSDRNPKGGDSEAAPSRSDDSAGRNGIAQTPPVLSHD